MANNPLPDAALAELDRIYAAVSKEYANGEKCLTENVSKALEFANDIHRAYPALRQRLLDAESRVAEAELTERGWSGPGQTQTSSSPPNAALRRTALGENR